MRKIVVNNDRNPTKMLSGFPIIKLSKEFKMYQYFISGGPFMLPMLVGLVLAIFIAYKNIFNQYHTDKIIIIGAATSLLGIVSTVVGMNDALEFSKNMSKCSSLISPSKTLSGLVLSKLVLLSLTNLYGCNTYDLIYLVKY